MGKGFRVVRLVLLVLACGLSWKARSTTYAVVCGVSEYRLKPLRFSDDDAAGFYQWLLQTGVAKANVTLLLNQEATTAKVSAAMKEQFGKARAGDVVIFFFSGHGAQGYFITYGAELGGLPLSHEAVRQAFKETTAAYKLCFADACYAGGLLSADVAPPSLAFQNAKYTDFKAAATVAVIMSSRPQETSSERQELKKGLFTHFLLLGLGGRADADSNGLVTVGEIFAYLSSNVISNSNQTQHPVLTGRFSPDLVLAKIGH